MPYLTVDGLHLYYEEEGTGCPLLFIHGLGSSTEDWFRQVAHFAEQYRVIRIDLRGHGRSDRGQGPYHMQQFSRDVAVVLRRLSAAPAHIVGLSMGGMVSFQLALDAPTLVRSLTIVNSGVDARLRSWQDLWFYVSRRMAVKVLGMRWVGRLLAGRLFPKPEHDELRREFIRRWSSNDKRAYIRSMDAIMGWSVKDKLARMIVPTLLVSAEHDYTPVSEKNRIAARMPNAELAVVEDAHHALPVEKPDGFNAVLDRFLDDVSNDRFRR